MAYTPINSATLIQIMNSQGTHATSANQAIEIAELALVVNNQGSQATSALQTTGNAIATVIMNSQGTLASSVASGNLATALNVYTPSGTRARDTVSVEVSLDGDTFAADSFGRLRVSNPDYRFDAQLVYQISSDVWDTAFSAGGTVTYDRTNKWATVTATANGTSVLQGHYHAPYTPGRSQLACMTFLSGTTPGFNAYRRIGYYDGTNGVYLEHAWDGVRLVLASSTSVGNKSALQSAWNIDKMDGTGRSGLTLDLTKIQILMISLQALYSGRVIVGFDIDGIFWPVHQFVNANRITSPYIAQASLPVRYEAKSTGSNVVQLQAICASVMSEGGGSLKDMPARTFNASSATNSTSVTTRKPVLSIRARQQLNQINQNGVILPISLSVKSNVDVLVELVRNATLTGASWIAVDTANSIADYDTSATTVSSGGTVFSSYSLSTLGLMTGISDNLLSRLVVCYSHLLATADTLSVVCTSTGGNASTLVALNWKEIR